MSLSLDEQTLEEARSFNRKLDWAPRFRINNRVVPLVVQSLLRLSQFGADSKLAREGIRVARLTAYTDGLRVPVRVLRGAVALRGVVLDFHGGGWASQICCVASRAPSCTTACTTWPACRVCVRLARIR